MTEIPIRDKQVSESILTKRVISELKQKSQSIGHEAHMALKRILGKDLQVLTSPYAKPDDGTPNLFSPLLVEILDKRTASDVTCTIPPHGNENHKLVIQERAAPINTRTSFLSKTLESIDRFGSDVSIARIDLERFRDADFDVGSKDGIRPADVLINTTARTIRETLIREWNKKGTVFMQNNTFEVGRYGGDELVILFGGSEAQEERSAFMKSAMDELSKKTGFYKDKNTGEIQELPIQFKSVETPSQEGNDSRVEWIHIPKKDEARAHDMYREYLERGLILNRTDFEREKKKYLRDGKFSSALYKQDYPNSGRGVNYPPNAIEVGQKVQHLAQRHTELAPYFQLAKVFDTQEGSTTKRQDTLLKIIESSIFDRLLGDKIYSRPHFIEHMRNKELKELRVIDLKFLKEINSAMTYADADGYLKDLWNKINIQIPFEEQKSIIVSRFAGAIYIGTLNGHNLSRETSQKLDSTTSLQLGKENPFIVPLGHAKIDLSEKNHTKLQPYEALNLLEEQSDKTFYENLMRDICVENMSNNTFIQRIGKTIDVEHLINRPYQHLSKDELYALFLRGSRKFARTVKLLGINNHIYGDQYADYSELSRLLQGAM